MTPAGAVTLVGVALTVATLALYLIRIAFILKHVNFTLGTIIAGLRAIANQTEPVGPVINEINADLQGVQAELERVVNAVRSRSAPSPSPNRPV